MTPTLAYESDAQGLGRLIMTNMMKSLSVAGLIVLGAGVASAQDVNVRVRVDDNESRMEQRLDDVDTVGSIERRRIIEREEAPVVTRRVIERRVVAPAPVVTKRVVVREATPVVTRQVIKRRVVVD